MQRCVKMSNQLINKHFFQPLRNLPRVMIVENLKILDLIFESNIKSKLQVKKHQFDD